MRKSTLVIARFNRVSLMIAHLNDVQPNNGRSIGSLVR
jgi:hypothetical protein